MKVESNIICVAADTMIATETGEKRIEDVRAGSRVITFDFDSQATRCINVERHASSRHGRAVKIGFSHGRELACTEDHPLWVLRRGWSSIAPAATLAKYGVDASHLVVGDSVLSFDGVTMGEARVTYIQETHGDFQMYVISGGADHCFFANGVLVHDENVSNICVEVPVRLPKLRSATSSSYNAGSVTEAEPVLHAKEL